MINLGLKDWAKNNGYSYSKAYRKYKKGELQGAFIEKGDIYIPSNPTVNTLKEEKPPLNPKFGEYLSVSSEGRKNRSADAGPDSQFANISNLFSPYFSTSSSNSSNTSNLSPQDVVVLCQKAYYGVATIKRVVDTLQYFCTSRIFLKGGNAKSRKFYDSYFKAIKLESFQSKFFLEYWRSGSNFIYKIKGKIQKKDLEELQNFSEAKLNKVELPVQYIILNPTDIVFNSSAFFSTGLYEKKLNGYEIQRLKNPQTLHEKQIYNALSKEVKEQIERAKRSSSTTITLPLKSEEVIIVFNNKQDYESFAIPPIYPVLDDVEHKMQLKKMDQTIAKTCQQAVLHVALGYEDKQGNYHYPEEAANKLEEIFASEDVGKVLITDFTAKIQFILPQIGDLLDPKKYTVVNQDIHEGLMDIVFGGGGGGEKFSNLNAKIKVFIERIKKARQAFLTEFLMPEMEIIGREMGFKAIPSVEFEEIDLEDNINYYRIIARLGEVGMLTPQEVFTAFDSGQLPTPEESVLNQEEFQKLKKKGLYQPILENKPAEPGMEGRPGGTSSPQTTKKVSPMGTQASIDILKENTVKFDKMKFELESHFKNEHSLESLSSTQKSFVDDLSLSIALNSTPDNWLSQIESYAKNGPQTNVERKKAIEFFATENNLSVASAVLVYANQ